MPGDRLKARSVVLGALRIVQCDLHHPRRFHLSIILLSYLKHLTSQEHPGRVPSSAHSVRSFTPKCRPKPTARGTAGNPRAWVEPKFLSLGAAFGAELGQITGQSRKTAPLA